MPQKLEPLFKSTKKSSYTRAQMEEIIKSGMSVNYRGSIISSLADLPSEADLALGNPEMEIVTLESLDQQIARLQAERAKIAKDAKEEF